MRLEEFRDLVRKEFGANLKHATPANVREFVDRLESELLPNRVAGRIVIDEPCDTYEEVIKDFFSKILDLPPEKAMVALWTVAFDLAFAVIETDCADRFASLFQDIE